RNTQLHSLNRISSTIRRVASLPEVMQQVLAGVIEGLGYDVCLLALFNKKESRIDFYTPKNNVLVDSIEDFTGFPLDQMQLKKGEKNSIVTAILSNRVVFRQELALLVRGVEPVWEGNLALRVQEAFGFKKFIIMPMVADQKVIGALIGISCTEFVDENRIDVLENFSNQAALALETAQLFEELKRKNLELERASRMKSEFLAMMSHELRTPLTAIMGFTELLMEGAMGELNQEQEASLKEVIKNASHLLELINGVLDLAKIEAGKMELNEDILSIADLLEDVRSSLDPLMKKKHQKFLLKLEEGLPIFCGDAQKLKQVLINLLSNANKFTKEDGEILLSASFKKEKPLLTEDLSHLETSHQGYLKLTVKDTGIGIDQKSLKTIFNLFEQVDSSHTRYYQGTGLGLALTKQFVELHGGVIWVESELGKGSEFIILLPIKEIKAEVIG
ncbi:MAG: HAMP domain-containing histidine kinase, partial [Deltaproteobacteria bacterium]|nr:HAMP domain-containing histidine kinase [Deltaproteobacteria bacterium]